MIDFSSPVRLSKRIKIQKEIFDLNNNPEALNLELALILVM